MHRAARSRVPPRRSLWPRWRPKSVECAASLQNAQFVSRGAGLRERRDGPVSAARQWCVRVGAGICLSLPFSSRGRTASGLRTLMQSASPTAETLIRGSEAGFHLFDPARDDNEVERVEDAPLVRRPERFGDGKRGLESGLQREGAGGKTLGQSLALDHLNHENGTAFVIQNVVESGDSGVIERSEEPGLVLQARAPLGARDELIGKDLQGDLSPQPGG